MQGGGSCPPTCPALACSLCPRVKLPRPPACPSLPAQGALPADAGPGDLLAGGGGGLGAAAAALDPTMTIATKDAFAALNTMFKASYHLF